MCGGRYTQSPVAYVSLLYLNELWKERERERRERGGGEREREERGGERERERARERETSVAWLVQPQKYTYFNIQ